MMCGDKGRFARASNILSQHPRFLLDASSAKNIVETMKKQVSSNWYDVVRTEGVSERDADAIKGAFVYDGFDS
jgi:serine/threonine-protein kinase HipA